MARSESARAKHLRWRARHGQEYNARRRERYRRRIGEYAWVPNPIRWERLDPSHDDDIAQERALAMLEHRDPDKAERRYRHREVLYLSMTTVPYA
jgi:hypothetical protein